MLLTLGLLSAKGLLLLSCGLVQACFWELNLGMRLDGKQPAEEFDMLLENDGNDGAGDADDRGCETQSSDNESSHACSIVKLTWSVDSISHSYRWGCHLCGLLLLIRNVFVVLSRIICDLHNISWSARRIFPNTWC